MSSRSGGRWAALVALVAGVVFAWPTYVRYFGQHPVAMAGATLVAFLMYVPSVWLIRRYDRPEPVPGWASRSAVVFVILFAPIASRVMHALIDANLVTYWRIVGPVEEITKQLPLLLLAAFWPRAVRSSRDCVVYGALGGLGFAIVEFAANFTTGGYPGSGWSALLEAVPARWSLGVANHIVWGATAGAGMALLLRERPASVATMMAGVAIVALVMVVHGFNDLYGKFVGPLAIAALAGPAAAAGLPLDVVPERSALGAALLVCASVMNLLLVNLPLWPVLLWGLRRCRGHAQRRPQIVHADSLSG